MSGSRGEGGISGGSSGAGGGGGGIVSGGASGGGCNACEDDGSRGSSVGGGADSEASGSDGENCCVIAGIGGSAGGDAVDTTTYIIVNHQKACSRRLAVMGLNAPLTRSSWVGDRRLEKRVATENRRSIMSLSCKYRVHNCVVRAYGEETIML